MGIYPIAGDGVDGRLGYWQLFLLLFLFRWRLRFWFFEGDMVEAFGTGEVCHVSKKD